MEKISPFSLFLIHAIVIFDQNILVVNSKMKYFDENEQKSIICKSTVPSYDSTSFHEVEG